MGKIIASYLVKVHLHEPDTDAVDDAIDGLVADGLAEIVEDTRGEAPTNDVVKQAIIDGLSKELSAEITVSLIERTDD